MGLAATKTKQRFGLDPRNTQWSNDTARFGHKQLEKFGWKQGQGLGLVGHATTTHVKVTLKDDKMGLGAKLARKDKADEFDSGECTGLDVFQRLLGRLNGKEETINKELDRQREQKILNGKWGIHFIKGDVLQSTWDADTKQLISYGKKRASSEALDTPAKLTKKAKKAQKEAKKEAKEDKRAAKEARKAAKAAAKEAGEKVEKVKLTKEEKKAKKAKKAEKASKREEKLKRKAAKTQTRTGEEVTRESMLKPKEEGSSNSETAISTRLAVRSRWIRQKRAATMDAKALNEIFMITGA